MRCPWTGDDPLMIEYHDREWGVPVHDDLRHFEFLVLEGAQAGLSWRTVLHKREGYRRIFHGFDPERVARMDEAEVEAALADPSIIRNRAKVLSAVHNARLFLELQRDQGSFDRYIWGIVGGRPIVHRFARLEELPATSPESDALSQDLKRRGFKFVGSTVMYAHLQAAGLVNDHLVSCFRHAEV
jgi:DNA-3-methyladenine glycosylase I